MAALDEAVTLDPTDWSDTRAWAHVMLDEAIDDLQKVRKRKVWQPMPASVRDAWREDLPTGPTDIIDVYASYRRLIQPFGVGNRHPRFFGWVHGGGTIVGMLAQMLAGALNANCGGRDQAPIECERQVIRWSAEMLGLPLTSSGLLVTGSSMGNFIAVLVARTARLGADSRRTGVTGARLTAYASLEAHLCIGRAMDMAGLGSDALRLVPCDAQGRMDLAALDAFIEADRAAGEVPFLVLGTAGSAGIGAVDDLAAIAECCARHQLWFHVDAAFGAWAMLSSTHRGLLAGMERADSVAFDFHKWAQVPYDAGCIVVRDAEAHRAAFARPAEYLRREARGLAAGSPWPVDFGPELSRGFRALPVWMMLKTHGTKAIGRVVDKCCALAAACAEQIDRNALLERVAPVALNIVCFRYREGDDEMQAAIAADRQQAGDVVLSTTMVAGRVALRAAFVNHRTTPRDVEWMVGAVAMAGYILTTFGPDAAQGGDPAGGLSAAG